MTKQGWNTNFLVVGVGGQGILLAAEVIARVGVLLGYDVKKSEIHGMAQRGGSVTSQVRWGEQVYSPVFSAGDVDYLVALERLEALRYAHWLHARGQALVSDYRITPVSVTSGLDRYPELAELDEAFPRGQFACIPAFGLAKQAGQSRANNVVMLGALAAKCDIDKATWLAALRECVPARYLVANLAAFEAGSSFIPGQGEH